MDLRFAGWGQCSWDSHNDTWLRAVDPDKMTRGPLRSPSSPCQMRPGHGCPILTRVNSNLHKRAARKCFLSFAWNLQIGLPESDAQDIFWKQRATWFGYSRIHHVSETGLFIGCPLPVRMTQQSPPASLGRPSHARNSWVSEAGSTGTNRAAVQTAVKIAQRLAKHQSHLPFRARRK